MGNDTSKKKITDIQVEEIFNKNWIPYVWLVLVTAFLHIFGYIHTGDDYVVKSILKPTIWEEIISMPATLSGWSSRYLVNLFIHIMSHFDYRVWMVFEIIVFVSIYHCMRKYIANAGNVAHLYIIMNLFFVLPYKSLFEVGWITISMTYIWTTLAVLIACFSIKKNYEEIPVKWHMALLYMVITLYASTKEELSVMLTIIFGVALFYFVKHKKSWLLIGIQFLVSVFNVFVHIFSSGNSYRYEVMTRADFKGQHDFFDKIIIGVSATIKNIFLEYNYVSLVFMVVLVIVVWFNCKKIVPRVCSIVPIIILYFGDKIAGPNEDYVFKIDFNEYAMIVAGVIAVLSVLVCVIYLYGRSEKSLAIITILIAAFAGRTVVGFGNWGWQAYERTYYFLYFALMFTSSIFVCDMWEKLKKIPKQLVMTILILLGLLSTFINILDVAII